MPITALSPDTLIGGRRLADYREWTDADLPPYIPLTPAAAAPTINAVCPDPANHGHAVGYVVHQTLDHGQRVTRDVAVFTGPQAMQDAVREANRLSTECSYPIANWATSAWLGSCGCRL